MSKNFFAALDDSDDEGEKHKIVPSKEPKPEKPKKDQPSRAAEPSKTNRRRQPHGDRGTKQGRGGRPPVRDGKRQYDRRSGTGRGREIKKGGGGARNWGSDKNDARKAEGAVTEGEEGAALEVTPEVDEEPKEEPEKSEEAPAEGEEAEKKEEVVEDKTLTYDEYMASKQTPDTEAFKAIAVKEVENEFAGVSARKKDDEDFLVMGGGKAPRKKGAKKKEKQTLVASFKVSDPNSSDRRNRDRRDGDRRSGGRGGRGNRGGDRGGRHGGGRGSQKSKNIDVSDADAFPSL